MRKPKSLLLRSLFKHLDLALFSERNAGHNTQTITEIDSAFQKSRRNFIINSSKASILLGAGSLLSFESCNHAGNGNDQQQNNNHDPGQKKPEIAIIGGGIAGLHCAYILQNAGITASVYEADRRTGGRIYSQENLLAPGITTELGGEFIDSDHTDMLQLCLEFNLSLSDNKNDHVIKDTYFFNNKFYTEQDVFNEFKKIAKKIEDDRKSCGPDYDTDDAKRFDLINLEKYIQSLPCSGWLHELLLTACTAEFGLDASEQSSLNFISMISTDIDSSFKVYGDSDERFKIKGGNQKIISALENKLKGQVYLEHALVSIKTKKNKIELKFSNLKIIEVDHVVVAIPFSILRNIDMQIENMPEEKLKCINELGYGQNNKILLGFNDRPWRENDPQRSGYLFNNLIQNGWDHSQMQNDNLGTGCYTIFIGGRQSIDLAETAKINNTKDKLPGDELQKYLSELNNAFSGSKKSYNGNHKAVFWSNNPFIKGSYSCYKTGQWTTIAGIENESIGSIHFAGEHCSLNFQGFMNGGAETGRIAAEKIIHLIASEKEKVSEPELFAS